MFYQILSWYQPIPGCCSSLCRAVPSHLVDRKDELFPQCETGLWHLLLCIWLATLSAHLLIHCCQDGENIFSSAKTQSTLCVREAVKIRKITTFSHILTYTSANGSCFKQASKQLAKLLWTIRMVLLCPTLLFSLWASTATAYHLALHPNQTPVIEKENTGVAKKKAYGNIVTEDSCTPSAGTMPVCTRSPALGSCRKRNLAR